MNSENPLQIPKTVIIFLRITFENKNLQGFIKTPQGPDNLFSTISLSPVAWNSCMD